MIYLVFDTKEETCWIEWSGEKLTFEQYHKKLNETTK